MSMKLEAQVRGILRRLEDIDGQIDRLYQLSTAYRETADEIKQQVQDIRDNSVSPKISTTPKKRTTKPKSANAKKLPSNPSP